MPSSTRKAKMVVAELWYGVYESGEGPRVNLVVRCHDPSTASASMWAHGLVKESDLST